jgi:hypothetical protein
VITKPLGNPQIGEENIFYTHRVSSGDLFRPYPWFVQEALIGGRDITCVYIHGRSYFYECEFARHADAIDWRTEINTPQQSAWHLIEAAITDAWSHSVIEYMRRCKLHYGRLDFILHGDTLFFLECNSNGQFGWLDCADSLYLHHAFLDAALDPATMIGR